MRTIVSLVLLILSAINILIAMETETVSIAEGEMFELKCSTNLQDSVIWHFRRSDGTHEIFMGGEISKSYKDMFLLRGNQSLGEYNLLIPSADGRYAGNYKCIDDEGVGPEFMSIQLNITASTSTTYMLPITDHAPDAANCEAPKAAASIFQNTVHSNTMANPGVVSAIVLSVVIAVAAIIIVAIVSILKWCVKSKGKQDVEEQSPASSPDSLAPLIPGGPFIVGLGAADQSTELFKTQEWCVKSKGKQDVEEQSPPSSPDSLAPLIPGGPFTVRGADQ